MAKKILVVVGLFVLLAGMLFGFAFLKKQIDIKKLNGQTSQKQQVDQVADGSQKNTNPSVTVGSENQAPEQLAREKNNPNEFLGYIVEAEEYEDDSSQIFLTVEADLPDNTQVAPITSVNDSDLSEVKLKKKTFSVTVDGTTKILGGTIADLEQEEFVRVVAPVDLEATSSFVAREIEIQVETEASENIQE